MSLSPEQEAIWKSLATADIDILSDTQPIRLHVEDDISSPGDLYFELDRNTEMGWLSEDQVELASGFFGAILESGNPEAVIAELPRLQTERGLEIELVFPNSGDAHE